MKVLFVCWQNVSRSQMAEAYYNALTRTHNADSAGTQVERPGETLAERFTREGGTVGIAVMAKDGIDISYKHKTQLTKAMLDNYHIVVSMADDQYTPDWLRTHKNFVHWTVKDPGSQSMKQALVARDDIKDKVEQFIIEHQL